MPKGTAVSVGATLGAADGAVAAAALVPVAAGAFPRSVRAVREGEAELTLVMDSGVEVRLGTIGDLRLKLAIAKRILALAGAAAGSGSYVDVSVPERPSSARRCELGELDELSSRYWSLRVSEVEIAVFSIDTRHVPPYSAVCGGARQVPACTKA